MLNTLKDIAGWALAILMLPLVLAIKLHERWRDGKCEGRFVTAKEAKG